MPRVHKPRSGSMQFWPRKRARREYAKIRSWRAVKEAKPLGFAGYKVGMTHVMALESKEKAAIPVTIIECPPIKVLGVRIYKEISGNRRVIAQLNAKVPEKDALGRKISLSKKEPSEKEIRDFDYVRLLVYTQPRQTGIGKKKPEIFELAVGGSKEEQLKFAKEHLGKEMKVEDVLHEGMFVDIHGVTKGKGVQGPVKRFGVSKRSHKSEKTIRGPGSLGAWKAQQHMMYRVAHAGQMGYHTRTEANKWVLKLSSKPEEINRKGGFEHYGIMKNSYLLVKGSVLGPAKRLIRLSRSLRKTEAKAPSILSVQ